MKKKLLIIFILQCIIQFGCRNDDVKIVIKATGLDEEIKKIYLTSAVEWDVFLDSAECLNGEFQMNYNPKEKFEPLFASLCYLDKNHQLRQLYVKNEIVIKKTGKNASDSGFMLDYGTTIISNYEKRNGVDLISMTSGKENELFKQFEPQNFGYINSPSDEVRFTRVLNLIKKHPTSHYFLSKVYINREHYNKNQLESVMSTFDKSVQESDKSLKLKNYIKNIPQSNDKPKSLSLSSVEGRITKDINMSKKLNMLIFWASWCGPCRQEIPDLKKINEMISSDDFYMASISIDSNDSLWRKAVNDESQKWDQFIIAKKDVDEVMARYKFSSIPLIIFTNKEGKELKRISGFKQNEIDEHLQFINKSLR